MANPLDMLNYIAGVTIINKDDVLYIEDRRPTQKMGLSLGGFLAVLAIAVWSWLSDGVTLDAFRLTIILIPFVVALYFITTNNFREIYIFNKKTDSFSFTRQSVFRKDVLEGSASQFRAVQVEKRIGDDRDFGDIVSDGIRGTDSRGGMESYMVALMCQGLLFGQSDTQILRENPPLLSLRKTEVRIAKAISKFLGIPSEGVVDAL
jgi:hypothetical protein